MTLHRDHGTKIRSTSPLERLIGEIKRRTDPRAGLTGSSGCRSGEAGSFPASLPNEAAIIRLVGALLPEQSDERAAVGRRYMSLETLALFDHTGPIGLPAVAD